MVSKRHPSNSFKKISKTIAIITAAAFLIPQFSSANPAPDELKQAIDKKAQELQEINNKIQETQKSLDSTQKEGKTLQKEVSAVNGQISQLTLGIKSSEVKIEKLGLEMEELDYNISDTEKDVRSKKETIANIIKEMQHRGDNSLLLAFLKNKNLAEGIFETQSLLDINSNLSFEIDRLKELKGQLSGQLNTTSQKKQQKEIEADALKSKKLTAEELKNQKQTLLSLTKNKESAYQKMLNELEERRQEIGAEIEKIEAELRKQIDPNALPSRGKGVLAYPIGEGAKLTQGYGKTSFSNNYKSKWHNGIDLGAPAGTPLYAAEKGTIVATGNQDNYCPRAAYGRFIVVKHENNLTTLYAHLSLISAKVGDRVERGQVIGYSGKTGWSTGPHLHFTVFSSPTFTMKQSNYCGPMPVGGDLNPLDYIQL